MISWIRGRIDGLELGGQSGERRPRGEIDQHDIVDVLNRAQREQGGTHLVIRLLVNTHHGIHRGSSTDAVAGLRASGNGPQCPGQGCGANESDDLNGERG